MPRRARRRNRAARRRLTLVFALLFAPPLAMSARPARAACLEFTTPPLISGVPFRPTAVAAGDLDGDGDLDALVAARLDFSLAWFANHGDGSGWSLHTISTEIARPRSVQAVDLDSDGDLDVLAASHYLAGGEVSWFENDGAGGSWTRHLVSTASSQAPWSAGAADFDRDGDLDVLVPLGDSSAVVWFDNELGDGTSWVRQTIDATPGANPLAAIAADVDGDGDADAVSAAYFGDAIHWFANNGAGGGWAAATIAPSINGPRALAAGDLDRDGDLDLLAGARAASAIVWYRNSAGDGSIWDGVTVSTLAAGAYSVALADLDGDGDLDALSASVYDDEVVWHENDGAGADWTRHTLTTGANFATSVATGDVDGDGDADVLSAAYLGNELAWYRNDRLHDTALFAPAATLSTASGSFFSVVAADLDRDGDLDAVSTSYNDGTIALYRNLSPGDGSSWTAVAISTLIANPYSIATADLDGDGDVDVLSGHYGTGLHWFENTAGDASTFSPTTIHAGAGGMFTPVAADMDGDGDLDVAAANGYLNDRVDWFENPAANGDGSTWTRHTIATGVVYAIAVDLADLDGDGDLDALSAAANGDAVLWHENLAGDGSSWTTLTIATVDSPRDAAAADLDGDGDVDALMASDYEDRVAWYENLAGDGSTWSEHAIATAVPNTETVVPADVDGDGDLDALATATSGNAVAWFENDGTPAVGAWSQHAVSTAFPGSGSDLFAADVDGDGDLDALSSSSSTGQVRWHRNLGTGVFDDGFESDANKACWSSAVP